MNVERYNLEPPPEPSLRLVGWLRKIREGWRPNRRISGMGFLEASEFYGVYVWEYFNVISVVLGRIRPREIPEEWQALIDKEPGNG